MYKLLLVSDRDDVLSAFESVQNWERLGFRAPHIRHDFEGAKDSLSKHHADGISLAVPAEEEEKIIQYLRLHYPMVPIFQAGETNEEVLRYLKELKGLLNRIHADFSSDDFNEMDMLIECRHDFFRKLLSGKVSSKEDLHRFMRLLRSRMDPDRPGVLITLVPSASSHKDPDDFWEEGTSRLERLMATSFTHDVGGYHVLPLVTEEKRILLLTGPLHGEAGMTDGQSLIDLALTCAQEGIVHFENYQGLKLETASVQPFSSLDAFCGTAFI